jgi:ubiquinone/menaquinone biosynthesis C-methylase UbiE
MAELSAAERRTNSCCAPEQQTTCCEPSEKGDCCVPESSTCGCPAGNAGGGELREQVRERYAAAARTAGAEKPGGRSVAELTDEHGDQVFGGLLYEQRDAGDARGALAASLGCGVPTAVADLREGETVLDLGSGAGVDVLISARRVGPSGKVIGLDMTDEMLDLARRNAKQAGVSNVEFRKGYIEAIPLPDASIDVVISNCVLNLSADKLTVLREAARVLRGGGRLAISDVIADPDMDSATRADMQQWTGCIAGALTRQDFEQALADAGLRGIEVRETHRVHQHASAAIIRAQKPG